MKQTLAKITRPVTTDIVHRERLFRILDRDRKQTVVWLNGPPGCGKTTLISSYIETRKLSSLWYQLDENDTDMATFFYYMGIAAKKAAPRRRKQPLLFTPEYLQGISTFTRIFFEDLFSRLNTPFVMVFDDAQAVSHHPRFHEMMQDIFSIIPEGGNIIIISRNEPPAEMARLRANRTIRVLGADALLLTADETAHIAQQSAINGLSQQMIQALHHKTGGWVAGLILLLEQCRGKSVLPDVCEHHNSELIFHYFANEIFERMDQKTRRFLLETAVLPTMTLPMVEHITGLQNAGEILSDLNHHHYFTEKRSHPSLIYRYHPLFRAFLLSRAKDFFTRNDFNQRQQNAATLLQASGHIENAAELYRDASDWHGLGRLICSNAGVFIAQGRNRVIEQWITDLPEEILAQDPWLVYWLATCRIPFNPAESLPLFKHCFASFSAIQEQQGMALAFSNAISAIFHDARDFTLLDHWIAHLNTVQDASLPEEVEDYMVCSVFLALLMRQPDHREYSRWLEKALALFQKETASNLRLTMGFHLAVHYMWQGDLPGALFIIDALRKMPESKDVSPFPVITMKMTEAMYHWLTASYTPCLDAMNDALAASRSTGFHVWDAHIIGNGVAGALSAGDLTTAGTLLAEMKALTDFSKGIHASFYHYLASWYALLTDDMPDANFHQEMNWTLIVESGTPFIVAICHLNVALVLHQRGKSQHALQHLEQAQHIGWRIKSMLLDYMCLLAHAQFEFDQGKEKEGIQSLRQAMKTGRKNGFINCYSWRPAVMIRLCKKALQHGIEVAYVQDLILKRDLIPDTPPVDIEHWPWPLQVFTLGRFALIKNGKQLSFRGKTQKKPMEMLKTLIALGGNEVGEAQLNDALWPDAEGDTAHQSFATTLHRLRKLLGDERILRFSDGRLTLDERYCRVDVQAFEQACDHIHNAAGKGSDISGQLEKIMHLYQGSFLADERIDLYQAISLRERLRSRHIRAVGTLGQCYQQTEDYEKAVQCYLAGLETEPLAEDFYQQLMLCYAQLGNKAEAAGTYKRCTGMLASILGIKPSSKTQAIYSKVCGL